MTLGGIPVGKTVAVDVGAQHAGKAFSISLETIIQSAKLKTKTSVQTDVSIKAGGEADVRASELVKADVKAGGIITIYGKPSQINQKTTLGGTITESRR